MMQQFISTSGSLLVHEEVELRVLTRRRCARDRIAAFIHRASIFWAVLVAQSSPTSPFIRVHWRVEDEGGRE